MINLDRLKTALNITGLSRTNHALFQIIGQIIDSIRELRASLTSSINEVSSSGGTAVSGLVNATYLTEDDETSILSNSRRLLAGTNITFDDSVIGERTISSAATEREWSVLTDGAGSIIFADGDVVMTHVP
jgi:hypothetical protein